MMGNIQCWQCGYFENNDTCKMRCTRYDISVDKDSICVDCDELYASDDDI